MLFRALTNYDLQCIENLLSTETFSFWSKETHLNRTEDACSNKSRFNILYISGCQLCYFACWYWIVSFTFIALFDEFKCSISSVKEAPYQMMKSLMTPIQSEGECFLLGWDDMNSNKANKTKLSCSFILRWYVCTSIVRSKRQVSAWKLYSFQCQRLLFQLLIEFLTVYKEHCLCIAITNIFNEIKFVYTYVYSYMCLYHWQLWH
jgi:hypothetical protein